MINFSAHAEIIIGSDCNNKCTWFYDTQTQDLRIAPNAGASGDLVVGNGGSSFGGITINNVTIEEGITGFNANRFNTGMGTGYTGKGTLKLPESLKMTTASGNIDLAFQALDLTATNLQSVDSLSIRRLQNVILTPKEGFVFPSNFLGRWRNSKYTGAYIEGDITIQCRGEMALCEQMMAKVKEYENSLGVDFFVRYFDNRKRRIYTIDEAVEALGKNNKNTFRLKYR